MTSVADLFMKPILEATIASGDTIGVRHFTVKEGFSTLFEVHLLVRSKNENIDFSAVLGKDASFTIQRQSAIGSSRAWTGICIHIEQVGVEETEEGLSTYELTIVPKMWMLTQRRNHRMFQRMNEPDIVKKVLGEWGIQPELRIDAGAYKDREYRLQYGESDYDFVSRMLEDAGITFFFKTETGESTLILADKPQEAEARAPIPYVNQANPKLRHEWISSVHQARQTRPGKYVLSEWDFRLPPRTDLRKEKQDGLPEEARLERFHYVPSSFHYRTDKGTSYPVCDDKGKFRRDPEEGQKQVEKRLQAKQVAARTVTFRTSAFDVRPGVVVTMQNHPRSDLGAKLLVVSALIEGDAVGDWAHSVETRFADVQYRPALMVPRPRVMGIEMATVVGPQGEEIHTDEFGRVRVHFHWDRESQYDDNSSVWIPVSQPWAGVGFGGVNIPRIGQEVIVDFLGGDPDQPVVVGRLYTETQNVVYPLPANKTKSGWRSRTSPRGTADEFNELMFEDKRDQELVRLQAQKDYTALIKHDSGVVIRNDSMSHVGRDETQGVERDQTIRVGRDRKLRVQNEQHHFVDKDIFQQSIEATTTNVSKKTIYHRSEEEIVLAVGSDTFIHMTKEKIVIQSPKVYINPGDQRPPPPTTKQITTGVEDRDDYFFGNP